MWFQQDGARCHTSHVTMELLREKFGEHFISRSVPVNWAPKSYDFTPLDHFLRSYLKVHVYAGNPALIDVLKDNIEVYFHEIPAEMLERVCQKWTKRMDHLKRSRGQHLHQIIFKH